MSFLLAGIEIMVDEVSEVLDLDLGPYLYLLLKSE